MRYFWWEGIVGESSEIVFFQYFAVFALTMGAGTSFISVSASLAALTSAAATLFGAFIAERIRRDKAVALTSLLVGRLPFLLLAALPWLADGQTAMLVLGAVFLFKGAATSFSVPAWNGYAAATVAEDVRGRFFAFRNIGRQAIGLVLTPLAGLLLTVNAGAGGWQIAWLVSFVLGMAASCLYARVDAHPVTPVAPKPTQAGPKPLAPAEATGRVSSALMRFTFTTSLFQTFVMIAGPFFAIYLVREMGASPFWVGITAAASPLSALVSQPFVGRLADTWGPKRLLIAGNLLIILLPFLWLGASEPWHVAMINLIGGGAWAASLMATFNMLLAISPEGQVPRYTAVQQGGLLMASFVGPLIGGAIVPLAGFGAVFLVSGLGRILATALQFAWLKEAGTREVDELLPVDPSDSGLGLAVPEAACL
jgi:MFS family permease